MKIQFTFALITDTHIRPPQGDESSPFAVNDLANDRARHACNLIEQYDPAFSVHLGDMVHTLPHLPTYADACDEAHRIFAPLAPDLHFVAGNHDIGDKPMAISPAGPVDGESSQAYRRHFGNTHYAFEHENCLFAAINSSLVNTGSQAEQEQRDWLEATLARAGDVRIFLFSHYPPFIDSADEPAHYDNYEEPGRSWLLDLVTSYNVEAVFSGHVHQFFYNRHGDTRLYCLPPTSFTRQDYAELYRIAPTGEFGRNDIGKFSVALLDIYPTGHAIRVLPTGGQTQGSDESLQFTPALRELDNRLTVHLRHAWHEAIDLPFNGPMEEFGRKRARNDYTLVRLWQMHTSTVRVPLADLVDPVSRRRVLDFAAAGIRFTLFSVGIPNIEAQNIIREHAAIVSTLEIVTVAPALDDLMPDLAALDVMPDLSVHIGKAHSSAHEKRRGTKFAHNVSFGFLASECDTVLDSLETNELDDVVSGIVFQANLSDDLAAMAQHLGHKLTRQCLQVVINVRLAPESPADSNFDDTVIADRVKQARELALTHPEISFQLDTFADVDRGYSPRHGLIDRHYNLRPAGRMLAGMPTG